MSEFLDQQGLPGVRSRAGPEQPEGPARDGREPVARARRRRPPRPVVADRRGRAGPARRGLQPRRDELRGPVVPPARAHRRHHGRRRPADARGDPHRRRRREQPDPLLPGVVVGDVRQGPRDPPDRADAVPPALALRRRQGVRPPHDGQLPRVLRHPRVVGDLLQPRGPAARASSSSRARSPTASPASRSASRTRSPSATSTARATGDTPATSSRRCG